MQSPPILDETVEYKEAFYHIPRNLIGDIEMIFNGSMPENPYDALLRIQHGSRKNNSSTRRKGASRKPDQGRRVSSIGVAGRRGRWSAVKKIKWMLPGIVSTGSNLRDMTEILDRVLTHKFYGPIIFGIIMLLVFQAIFAWAVYPMDLIEGGFA